MSSRPFIRCRPAFQGRPCFSTQSTGRWHLVREPLITWRHSKMASRSPLLVIATATTTQMSSTNSPVPCRSARKPRRSQPSSKSAWGRSYTACLASSLTMLHGPPPSGSAILSLAASSLHSYEGEQLRGRNPAALQPPAGDASHRIRRHLPRSGGASCYAALLGGVAALLDGSR